MFSRIRDVRKARGLTLEQVAAACAPPTTAQTIGRLETGMRTLSLDWVNRIAGALRVDPSELVAGRDRPDLPVAAMLGGTGATAPTRPARVAMPVPRDHQVALTVSAGIGDYRAGDELWCDRLPPERFGEALNRDVLVPRPAGRFLFGRLIGREPGAGDAPGKLHLLPLGAGARQQVVQDPAWLAVAVRLVRAL